MIPTNDETRELLYTLQQIETLALLGNFNPLAALTARLLQVEIADSETRADAVERARAFVVRCQQEAKAA